MMLFYPFLVIYLLFSQITYIISIWAETNDCLNKCPLQYTQKQHTFHKSISSFMAIIKLWKFNWCWGMTSRCQKLWNYHAWKVFIFDMLWDFLCALYVKLLTYNLYRAVSAYFTSGQILPFGFCRAEYRYLHHPWRTMYGNSFVYLFMIKEIPNL